MINIKYFTLLPFIFIFLPSFVLFLSETTFFPLSIIVIFLSISILLLKSPTKIIRQIYYLYKKTPFKYLVYLYVYILISGLCAVTVGYYSFSRFIIVAVILVIFRIFLFAIYPSLVFPKCITFNNIIKFFMIAYLTILLVGFIEFVGVYFNIDIIQNFISFFSNIRDKDLSIIIETRSGLPRIRSFFMEPAAFAKFLTINLPMIYNLTRSRYAVFKNKLFNNLTKKYMVIMVWISLVLTQSPIFLILALFITIIYFYKNIIIFLQKTCIFITVLLTIFVGTLIFTFVMSLDLSQTYLIRILNVIEIIPKFTLDTIILVEPSLATRIINYINQFTLFLKHPLLGVGFGNTGWILIQHYLTSNIPLTIEMQINLQNATKTLTITSNAMYLLLYQTGIIGFALYCLFMIRIHNILNKVKNRFHGIQYDFILGLLKIILTIFIISLIYTQGFVDEYLFFICGISLAIILQSQNKKESSISIKGETNE